MKEMIPYSEIIKAKDYITTITGRYHNYYYEADNKALPGVFYPGIAIERVVYNDPATIVFWNDKTKTICKVHGGDTYSKEVGLVSCIAKKLAGNAEKFHNIIEHWVTDANVVELKDVRKSVKNAEKKPNTPTVETMQDVLDALSDVATEDKQAAKKKTTAKKTATKKTK